MKKQLFCLLALSLTILSAHIVHAQRITITLVGTGEIGYNNDNHPGPNSQVNVPSDVCTDATHNIYIADMGNGRIRKWLANKGTVTTYAGGGTSAAENIPATDAAIAPNYMCIDPAGNIYITTDNCVRKISAATGLIKTIAGSASSPGSTGDGGPAVAALLSGPKGISIDAAGNIFVADAGNNRIRKIAAGTGTITTVGGSATAGYGGDGGLATMALISNPVAIRNTSNGDIVFSDQGGTYIRRISASTGMITHVAGTGSTGASGNGGSADVAAIGMIMGICTDDSDNIYIDDWSCACREIRAATGIIDRVAGSLVTDGYNGDGGNALNMFLSFPNGLFIDHTGTLYIADKNNNRIRKAIQLTHTPSFAYGRNQSINPCVGAAFPVNAQMAVTDLDAGQSETWTVISAPAHGTLSGFPHVRLSNGVDTLTTPSAMAYASAGAYTGLDSFKIQVSDGTLADTVTVYATIDVLTPATITTPAAICTGATFSLSSSISGGIWNTTNMNASVIGSGVLQGMSPGTDTIIYTYTGTCTANDTAYVTVNLAPDPGSIVTALPSVCLGSTLTLTDVVTGGIWADDGGGFGTVSSTGVVTGLAYGTVLISYSVSNALCTASALSFIAVDSLPVIGGITGTSTMAVGGSVTLSVANYYAYGTWLSSDATIANTGYGGIVTGVAPGTAIITFQATNGCGTGQSTYEVTVSDNTGIKTPGNSIGNITISPNPAKKDFTINISATADEAVNIVITNIVGQQIKEITGSTNHPIRTSLDAPPGVYMLHVSGAHGNAGYKVVLE